MNNLTTTKSEIDPAIQYRVRKNQIFTNSKNFTTMKKLIFLTIMALFTLGLSSVYAQDPVIIPTELDPSCIDLEDPLRPVPGNPYTYEVDIPNPPGAKSFRWYVTQNEDFALNGVYNWGTAEAIGGPILAAGDGWYNALTANADAITLTWQSFVLDPGEYVFVVVYVENVNPAGCTNNNLKVYRILPAHAFTLDLANIDSTLNIIAANNLSQCVDDVVNAVFDPAVVPDGAVVYDYGKNIFYYGVAAANYSGQYRIYGMINGLQAATPAGTDDQSAEIYWGYDMDNWTNGPINATIADNGLPLDLGVVEAPGGGTIGQAGQMIYIKVIIRNHEFEAAAAGTDLFNYTFAVNGKLVDASGNPLAVDDSMDDLHFANCDPDLFVNDVTTQVLLARPFVNPVDPVFLPNGD